MKSKIGLSDGIASTLNIYEIKGLLNLIIMISDKARLNKHGVGTGKSIRRRNSDKEEFYGKCKSMKNTIMSAKTIKEFDKFIDVDEGIKFIARKHIIQIIDFIKHETIKHPVVLDEILKKIDKLSKIKSEEVKNDIR